MKDTSHAALPNSRPPPLHSDESQWYLTAGHMANNWTVMYQNDPLAGIPDNQTHLLLGGEACAWAEYMDNAIVMPVIFPVGCSGRMRAEPEGVGAAGTAPARPPRAHPCPIAAPPALGRRRGEAVVAGVCQLHRPGAVAIYLA